MLKNCYSLHGTFNQKEEHGKETERGLWEVPTGGL